MVYAVFRYSKGVERLKWTRHVALTCEKCTEIFVQKFSEVTTVEVRNGWVDIIKMVFREFCMLMLLKRLVHSK